jgi:hypothetical protein
MSVHWLSFDIKSHYPVLCIELCIELCMWIVSSTVSAHFVDLFNLTTQISRYSFSLIRNKIIQEMFLKYRPNCGQNTRIGVVDLTTRFGLGGPGIESGGDKVFPQPSIPVLRPTQPPVKWLPSLFPGSKATLRGVDHPPLSSSEVKERVELCPTSSLGLYGVF